MVLWKFQTNLEAKVFHTETINHSKRMLKKYATDSKKASSSLRNAFCTLVLTGVYKVDYLGFLYIKRLGNEGSFYGIVIHQ